MFGAFTSVVVLLGLIFFREDLEDELYRENANGTNYELKQFMDQPGKILTKFELQLILKILFQLEFNMECSDSPSWFAFLKSRWLLSFFKERDW
jgi:hypothetical protein